MSSQITAHTTNLCIPQILGEKEALGPCSVCKHGRNLLMRDDFSPVGVLVPRELACSIDYLLSTSTGRKLRFATSEELYLIHGWWTTDLHQICNFVPQLTLESLGGPTLHQLPRTSTRLFKAVCHRIQTHHDHTSCQEAHKVQWLTGLAAVAVCPLSLCSTSCWCTLPSN